jgi:ATPase subunit of ABC transporter with duplicated ATPase domains
MGWPAELGPFPELQARTVTASEWQTLVMQRSAEAAEAKRKAEEEAAMRAELARLRQVAAEAEAERQKMAAEIEAARRAEQAAAEAARRAEQAAEQEARRAEQAAAEAARKPEQVSIQVVETEPEPIEQPTPVPNPFLRQDAAHQPPTPAVKLFAGTGRDDRTRLRDLIKRLAEITAHQGEIDWRAEVNQAMQEAME